MKIFVVKYDDTQPYDPGTCLIIGAYSSLTLAVEKIAAAKAEKVPTRFLKNQANWRSQRDEDYEIRMMPKYYGSLDDVFEIVEVILDA